MISFDQKDITVRSDIGRKGMIIMILVSVISLVVNLERDHPLLLLGLTVRHPLLSDLSCHAHRPESNLVGNRNTFEQLMEIQLKKAE